MAGPAVTSPFGNRPNSLMQPDAAPMPAPQMIPDFGGVAQITGQPAGTAALQSQQPQPEPAAPSADPFASLDQELGLDQQMAGLDAELGLAEPTDDPNAVSTEAAPTGWESAKEQIREAGTRFKNAFTVTGKESLDVLKQSGMFDDVRQSGGEVEVKRKGRKGWEKFDRDKFELVGDTIDFARDAFEGIAETAIRAGGAAAGAAAGFGAGGVGAFPGGAAGYMAAGAGSAIAAKNAGDWFAQDVMEVPRDESRNMTRENLLAGTFGAGAAAIGSVLARRAASKLAMTGEATKTMDFAKERIQDTMDDIADVSSAFKLQDGKYSIKLDPQQMVGAGAIPELDATAKELSTTESFRNMRRQVADKLVSTYNHVAETLGAQAGRGANLADDFVLTANDIRKVEGKYVTAFKEQAAEQLKGAKGAAPRTAQLIQKAASELGIGGVNLDTKRIEFGRQMAQKQLRVARMADGKAKKEALKALRIERLKFAESMGTDKLSKLRATQKIQAELGLNPAQAKLYQIEVQKLMRGLQSNGGTMSLDASLAKADALTSQINKHMGSGEGRAYASALMDLRNAVRDDGLDMMENSFRQMGGDEASNKLLQNFMSSKARYRDIVEATDGLGKMLQTDNLSRNEMIGKLFEGKGAYKFAMNAKTLINETNPKLWNQMAGEFFDKMKHDATDAVTNTVNWGQISKKWSNLDPRLQKELMDSTGIDPSSMNALLRLGTRVQGASFDALAREGKQGMVKNGLKALFVLWGGGATAKGGVAGSLVSGMGKDQAVMKWLKDGGAEEILQEMPGLKADKAAAIRQWVSDTATAKLPEKVDKAGKAIVGVADKVIDSPVRKAVTSQTLRTTSRRRAENE